MNHDGAADPRVHWPATNLRELGGYETPHGRVRHGALYRGGRMDELGADGHAVYAGLGLDTIIDLRRPDEVADSPTPQFGDERNVHLSVSTGSNAFAEAAARADDPATAGEVLAQASAYFRVIVTERLGLWQPVFDTVLAAEGRPVLFHCTAGKDRTGFLAAALLKFLDADDDLVFADFELSTHVRRPWAEERLEFHRHRMAAERGVAPDSVESESLDAWWALMTAPPEFLRTTLDTVEEVYGDWHTMRREGLGISDDRLATWRSQILD